MRALALALLIATPAVSRATDAPTAHPEAKPFGHIGRARHDIDTAFRQAKTTGRRVILVFGANWCHDSRALAGWFATPRFRAMLAPRYEIAWIDVGKKDKNLDLARRFGLDGIKGTPTVLVADADGHPLNLGDAPTWHDASQRSEQAIFDYFAGAPAR